MRASVPRGAKGRQHSLLAAVRFGTSTNPHPFRATTTQPVIAPRLGGRPPVCRPTHSSRIYMDALLWDVNASSSSENKSVAVPSTIDLSLSRAGIYEAASLSSTLSHRTMASSVLLVIFMLFGIGGMILVVKYPILRQATGRSPEWAPITQPPMLPTPTPVASSGGASYNTFGTGCNCSLEAELHDAEWIAAKRDWHAAIYAARRPVEPRPSDL